jgi:hypothetical protein
VHGDVESAVADGVVGAAKAARIAQFGDDRGGGHRPDPVQPCDQRPAARLTARKQRQRPVQRRQLVIDHVDHPQRQRQQLTTGRRQLDRRKRLPASAGARPHAGRHALVEQLRLQPLLPSGALVDQRLAQPHARAQLQNLRRRDPRLRSSRAANSLSSSSQSARSVFARRLRPRLAAVSAGSARWARWPARSISSTTNRQPVVPSSAKPTSSTPSKRASHSRTDSREAGLIRPRHTSPLPTSTIAYVICRR